MNVALQLYSVREDMEKYMAGTLKRVKEIGYDYVEFAGYFGKEAREIRKLLDENNIKCVSVHQVMDIFSEDETAAIEYLKTIGASCCAVPWMSADRHKGSVAFDKTLEEFTRVGTALKKAGIQLLYHNHDFEFQTHENKFLLDWLYESLPADILQTEIDICWVRYAGYNPSEYIRKYKGRSPIVHLKDFVCDEFNGKAVYNLIDNSENDFKPNEQKKSTFMFKPVGYGIQDIPSVLEAAKYAGAHTVVVEMDESPEYPAMESARMAREYLRNLL